MKTSSIFFGSFFVVVGGLFLAKNFGIAGASIDGVWKFWPVVLIALGASYLMSNEGISKVLSAVSGVLAGVILWTFVEKPFEKLPTILRFDNHSPTAQTQSLIASIDAAPPKFAACKLIAGGGEFILNDTSFALLQVDSKTSFGGYELRQVRKGELDEVEIEMNDVDVSIGQTLTNQCVISLHPLPVWKIDVEIGAAKLDFDLSKFIVQSLKVESGAASIQMKLGERSDSVHVELNASASKVTLLVPKTTGCEIDGESDFASKIIADDFVKVDNDKLRTTNFDTSSKRIFVMIEGGLSKLVVKRY